MEIVEDRVVQFLVVVDGLETLDLRPVFCADDLSGDVGFVSEALEESRRNNVAQDGEAKLPVLIVSLAPVRRTHAHSATPVASGRLTSSASAFSFSR